VRIRAPRDRSTRTHCGANSELSFEKSAVLEPGRPRPEVGHPGGLSCLEVARAEPKESVCKHCHRILKIDDPWQKTSWRSALRAPSRTLTFCTEAKPTWTDRCPPPCIGLSMGAQWDLPRLWRVRRLPESKTSAVVDWVSKLCGVRKAARIRLSACQRNRVQARSATSCGTLEATWPSPASLAAVRRSTFSFQLSRPDTSPGHANRTVIRSDLSAAPRRQRN
jgi:hypothetical protein